MPWKFLYIQEADPIREKVNFCYYRLAKGIFGILSYAKEGIRLWYRTKRPAYRQLCLKLTVWIDIVPCGYKRICLPKPGPGGAYKSASILGTAIRELSKKTADWYLERTYLSFQCSLRKLKVRVAHFRMWSRTILSEFLKNKNLNYLFNSPDCYT